MVGANKGISQALTDAALGRERVPLDVDEPASWSDELRELVASLAVDVPDVEAVVDLALPDNADDRVRELLDGRDLLVFHATRLFDHELGAICSQGLRVFGRELFEDRIDNAYRHGAIDQDVRDLLRQSHMYATSEQHNRGDREGVVCLVLGSTAFTADANSLAPLLGTWGGEGIYFSAENVKHEALLQSLGRPAIVVAAVPVMSSWREQTCYPDLTKVLVGTYRHMRPCASIHHPASVPGPDIIDIWQPGHPSYDRYTGLAQE